MSVQASITVPEEGTGVLTTGAVSDRMPGTGIFLQVHGAENEGIQFPPGI